MRYTIILLILCSSLFSSAYKDAIKLYNNSKYIQAYAKFYILHKKNERNNHVSIYLAKTMYDIGEFKKAKKILLPIYKRSHNCEAGLFLAKVYFYEKNYTKAKKILLKITEKQHRKEVKRYLKMINSRTNLHHFSLYASIGITNDDNIHDDTYISDSTIPTQKDDFIDKILYIVHQYKPQNSSLVTWSDKLFLFDKSGIRYDSENFSLISLSSGPHFSIKNFHIQPHIILKNSYYKSHHYMYDYGFGLDIYKNINNSFDSSVYLSYEKYKYIQSIDKTRDANNLSLSLVTNQYLNDTDWIKYLFAYSDISKEKPGRVDISRYQYSGSIGYSKKFLNGITLNLNLQYKEIAYKDADINLRLRNDRETTSSITVSKKIKSYFTVLLGYNHIENRSNIDWNDYKKNTINLTIYKIF